MSKIHTFSAGGRRNTSVPETRQDIDYLDVVVDVSLGFDEIQIRETGESGVCDTGNQLMTMDATAAYSTRTQERLPAYRIPLV